MRAHFHALSFLLCLAMVGCVGDRQSLDPDVLGSDTTAGTCGGSLCADGEICVSGRCLCEGGDGGFDPCTGGRSCCPGVGCRDFQADAASCGGCGVVCAADQVCSGGSCTANCEGGLDACGGDCANLQTSNDHCGGCEQACSGSQTCVEGTCLLVCDGSLTECTGSCVNLDVDPNHCGQCGNACAERCEEGACVTSSICTAPERECVTGTCVDVSSSREHCGACGNPCSSQENCEQGECRAPPVSGTWQLAAGAQHTCGISPNGVLYCWGNNGEGEIGVDSPDNPQLALVQPLVSSPVVKVCGGGIAGTGSRHTCAVHASSGLSCWGHNGRGQLGDGSVQSARAPVAVQALERAESVVCGGRFSCALDADGTAWCWGDNNSDQLGDGSGDDTSSPSRVNGPGIPFVKLAAGREHTCAITSQGDPWCWGRGDNGRLGNGSKLSEEVPYGPIVGVADLVDICAGSEHTCAVTSLGQVQCWGGNDQGQLGMPGSDVDAPVAALPQISDAVAVRCGHKFTCVMHAAGGVSCFGDNSNGQLGNDSSVDQNLPVAVQGLAGSAVDLALGHQHACVALANGRLQCWGDNNRGQLGDGTTNDTRLPVDVVLP